MANQPDPVMTNIINWCQEDNIPCEDNRANRPNVLWSLHIGTLAVSVYKLQQIPDRIYVQSGITLSTNHRTLVNQNWEQARRNDLMMKLKMLATQYDVYMNFGMDGDNVLSFSTIKIHFHTSISKAEFLSMFLRVSSIHEIILNQLNLALGLATQQLQASQDAGSDNPLSG